MGEGPPPRCLKINVYFCIHGEKFNVKKLNPSCQSSTKKENGLRPLNLKGLKIFSEIKAVTALINVQVLLLIQCSELIRITVQASAKFLLN